MAKDDRPVLEKVTDELDKLLLKVIKEGVPLLDNKGNAVLDEKGKPIMVPPAAAYLQAARQRLKDAGYGRPADADDPLEELADELGLTDKKDKKGPKIFKMPAVSEEQDEATKVG